MSSTSADALLPAGKLPLTLLSELLAELPTSSSQLLLGPAAGEDAAVIDFAPGAERVLVAKSDPITFATDEIGYYAVNICTNDLAVTGATPLFYLPTLLLPADGVDEGQVREIFRQIGAACAALGIVIAGGHSEITHAVRQPVIAGTLLGEAPRDCYISSRGGRPGDAVLMAGSAPVEGTSVIAREMRDVLLADGWSESELDEAAAYLHDPGISVMAPALAAVEVGGVTGMHDPTEGGVCTGLVELGHAAGTGLEVDLDAIRISDLSRRLCAHFDLDPFGVIASGALLATVEPAQVSVVVQRWADIGWQCTLLGRLRDDGQFWAYQDGERVVFPTFAADEITRLWQ